MIKYIIYILFICIFFKIFLKNQEYFPFMISSPPKRNISYDLRCDPYIPKINISPWSQSTINYYYRPKCLNL